jgi:ferric-dicitrate binding protein FerR (iron transport regulator)
MRRIYSSPRIENIERLVNVMAEHGIATRVTNRRVYEGSSYRRFSYARPGHSDDWPAVWVRHANDHTRARELMREIGIEPATRYAEELSTYRFQQSGGRNPRRTAARVRTLALLAVAVAVAIYAVKLASVW